MNTVWRVFSYLRRYPALAAGTLACAIFGTLMVIVFPAVTKSIVDEVVTQRREDRLMPLVLFAALAFLLQHGLNALRIILNNTFEQRVIFDLRSALYSHIQMLPLRWFDNRARWDPHKGGLRPARVRAGALARSVKRECRGARLIPSKGARTPRPCSARAECRAPA